MKVAVAGAGLSGATIAERLAAEGHDVTVYDRRPHLAGNAHDYVHHTGVRVHQYGPHIFHTKNKRVFEYLSRFTEFLPYEHRVTALTTRGYVPFPPNKNTLAKFDVTEIVDVFYRPYTELMWDRRLEDVSPKILDRVPMRFDEEDRYFPEDSYQGMPKDGYDVMVLRMLDKCSVRLNTPLVPADFGHYDRVFYCGSPDALFHNSFGRLPYRTIHFNTVVRKLAAGHEFLLPTTTVNYAGDILRSLYYTRVTEWKHFPNNDVVRDGVTTLTFERPDFATSDTDCYYPIRTGDSIGLYDKYVANAEIIYPNVTFIGRCGNFVYIDMDQAINMALVAADKMLKKESQ